MLASDIIDKVADRAQDDSFTSDIILALINEARGKIADDFDLPNLKTSSTVTTSSAGNSVALPDDYHKKMFFVSSSSQRRRIGSRESDYHNISTILNKFPNMDTVGEISDVVVDGTNLLYQGQADDTLTLRYYKNIEAISENEHPTEITGDTLQFDLLFNYCLKEIFDAIEDEAEATKKNTNYYDHRFGVAMTRLQRFIEISKPREPKYIKGMD